MIAVESGRNTEQKLLSPGPAPELRVNSTILLNYLVVSELNPKRKVIFPKQFDLGFMKPNLMTLYNDKQQVFTLQDQLRDELIQSTNNLGKNQNGEAIRIDNSGPSFMEYFLNEKSEAERLAFVFYDRADCQYRVTKTVHGEYEQVQYNPLDMMPESAIPLISIHTHPNDTLFSAQDYSLILTNASADPNLPMRWVKALMVLCPSIQVLALPTKDTPIFTPEEAKKFTDEWDSHFSGNEKRYDTLYRRYTFAQKAIIKIMTDAVREHKEVEREIDDSAEEEGLSESEKQSMAQKLSEPIHARQRFFTNKALRMGQRANIARLNYLNGMLEFDKVALARALHLKLYSSTDMQHFNEFTA